MGYEERLIKWFFNELRKAVHEFSVWIDAKEKTLLQNPTIINSMKDGVEYEYKKTKQPVKLGKLFNARRKRKNFWTAKKVKGDQNNVMLIRMLLILKEPGLAEKMDNPSVLGFQLQKSFYMKLRNEQKTKN